MSTPLVISEIVAGDAASMRDAGRMLPAFRGDGVASASTMWRWVNHGLRTADGRMLKLEAARVGGRWLTSKAAIERFIAAQTPGTAVAQPAEPKARTPEQRQRAAEAANARLAAAGA